MESRFSTQLRIDETLASKLKYIAEQELRTMNAQIEYFIKQGVARYEEENGYIILSDA